MAQQSRSSRRRGRSGDRETGRQDRMSQRSPLVKPETRHGVVIVVLLTLATVTALSVAGQAGTYGRGIANAAGALFGWQRFLLPLYLGVIGFLLLWPEKYRVSIGRWIGFGLTVVASEGLLQLFLPYQESIKRALAGDGGGYVGVALHYPLVAALGPWAGGLIMFGLFLIGFLVTFNTSLNALIRQGSFAARWRNGIRTWLWRRRLGKIDTGQIEAADAETGFTRQHLPENGAGDTADEVDEPEEPPLVPVPPPITRRPKRNIVIPLDLLDGTIGQPTSGNIDANKDIIKKTLENFGIQVEMDEINVGPTVTQYTLRPSDGVKLAQITALNNDLALALAAHPIRIEAPIPGKSLVGIEVPNQSVALVRLREILSSGDFQRRTSNLTFSLGKDVSGKPWVANLDPLPHLLVAGATGSGKSVLINGLIISLLYSNSPDDLKLVLVDPKRVELTVYNDIPHLLTPVITDTTKTINALRWVVGEMDRRYSILQQAGKRNIGSYRAEGGDLPYIVLIIDELADLMAVAANEVEGAIVRLAQMARAVGIHLVLATQRPSVDVITGLIKANVTARVAFSVASQVDSRTILDTSGAEKLLGKGDMLFIAAELSKPKRLQGAYVSETEVERVAQFLKSRGQPDYLQDVVDKPAPMLGDSLEELGDDELLGQAKEVILQADKASASLLQRRLRIGYARAARILDLLEKEGFIGPGAGAKPREVFGSSSIPPDDAPPEIDDPGETDAADVMDATDDDQESTADSGKSLS